MAESTLALLRAKVESPRQTWHSELQNLPLWLSRLVDSDEFQQLTLLYHFPFQGEVFGFVGMSYLLGGLCVLALFIFLQVVCKVKIIRRTESEAGNTTRKNHIDDVCPFQEQTLVSICSTSWEENFNRHHQQLIDALLRDHRDTTVWWFLLDQYKKKICKKIPTPGHIRIIYPVSGWQYFPLVFFWYFIRWYIEVPPVYLWCWIGK